MKRRQPFSPKKKKPETRNALKESNGTNERRPSSESSAPETTSEELVISINPIPTESTSEAQKTISKDLPSDISIPTLKGLGSLRKKAEEVHEEEKKRIPVLTLPAVLDFWKTFSAGHDSPSMRQTMNEAILEIKNDHTIGIRTGNQTGKNRILNEMNLIEGLRSLLRIPNLQIDIEIDPDLDRSKEIAKPKKLLSNREKFDILSAKNPLINKLRDKLDLIPDQDE